MYNKNSGGSMKLIVGLGNIGKEYEKTRHNIGFMVIDKLIERLNVKLDQNKFKTNFVKTKIAQEDVIIAKPLTYMNLSGEAVLQIASFFRIDNEDILIIHDDLDLPLGRIRLRDNGKGGNHNGMKNIVLHLNDSKIPRIRIGIGKDPLIPQKNFVLGRFNNEEMSILDKTIDVCVDAIYDFTKLTFSNLMNKYNPSKDE